jgi:HK97 family phage prohead protease
MEVKKLSTFVRSLPFEQTGVDQSNDGLNFSGYAAVFNSPTRIDSMWEGEFDETILSGAFAKSLREQTPVFQFDHGKHPLIGSIPLGNITRAEEDTKGLYIEARLSDNWLIQPVRDAIASGSIDGMSFRFSVPEGGETWVETSGKVPSRTLSELKVPELGPVVFPAYDKTTAAVRSKMDELEEYFKNAGRLDTGRIGGGNKETAKEYSTAVMKRDRLLRMKGILR